MWTFSGPTLATSLFDRIGSLYVYAALQIYTWTPYYYAWMILLGLLFYPEVGGSMFPRNTNELLPDCTASHSRKWYSSKLYIHEFITKSWNWLIVSRDWAVSSLTGYRELLGSTHIRRVGYLAGSLPQLAGQRLQVSVHNGPVELQAVRLHITLTSQHISLASYCRSLYAQLTSQVTKQYTQERDIL
jgi:hypothetical protein